ncbi:MucB/RseB C-terminal domain-containing protein [Testudinibacter sp. TR-2022]|uniref:MucB/RseB C-terminal domain-containing protein n=1 Tax=Testudinibacter sp. TR-2022 TaxID=2585029 RepID=UPI0011185A45|nr:MucB/RseB C-terminal domain-containing protein [Testudinibacter sp. TR-2022]TNH09245.1 sigma-E factor regulatory protein RseB [Pasteurellaceae bacterium Phil11]TNH25766.1 sigma-E factor regulatory protein RseB [Testudinibacter sp. TR-2022]TNH28569.1 sigma-E factor regulatory protein RseB [Testudinibacter sp. TR-2022]
MKLFKTVWVICAALTFSSILNAQQNSQPALQPLGEPVQNPALPATLLDTLQRMAQTWRHGNYEMAFIQILPNQVNSYQYRHVFTNQRHYAQLSALDGVQQEVVQRDAIISYYGNGYQPFSIKGPYILDNIPSVVYADYDKLKSYYDFVDAGKTRIADRVAQVIRLLPKDDFRYQYVLWLDEQSHLLLRSDMLERNGELLEQFRVIALQQDAIELQTLSSRLDQLNLPPLINVQGDALPGKQQWRLAWLPPGFQQIKHEYYQTEIGMLESVMFSDGLFSFSLYINHNIEDKLGEHYWQQAGNTIYSEVLNNREITLIGQIPLATAKRIVKDLSFDSSGQ